jgi:hypothetical protein
MQVSGVKVQSDIPEAWPVAVMKSSSVPSVRNPVHCSFASRARVSSPSRNASRLAMAPKKRAVSLLSSKVRARVKNGPMSASPPKGTGGRGSALPS